MITGSAVKRRDGTFLALPKPNRHHHVLRALVAEGEKTPIIGEQGFVDDKGNFLDRMQARMHAVECGQVEEDNLDHYREIFSEDLW